MAWSSQQAAKGTSAAASATPSFPFTSAVNAGDLMVCVLGLNGLTRTLASGSMADDASGGSNAWVVLGPIDNTHRLYLAYAVAVRGGAANAKPTYSGSISSAGVVHVFHSSLGALLSNAAAIVDTPAGVTAAGSPISESFVPSASGELVVAGLNADAGITVVTPTGGFTSGATQAGQTAEEYLLSCGNPAVPGWTYSGAVATALLAAAFKEPTGVAPASSGGVMALLGVGH